MHIQMHTQIEMLTLSLFLSLGAKEHLQTLQLTSKLLTSSVPTCKAMSCSIWLQSFLIFLGVYWFKPMTNNHIKIWQNQMCLNSCSVLKLECISHKFLKFSHAPRKFKQISSLPCCIPYCVSIYKHQRIRSIRYVLSFLTWKTSKKL
ncbi:hypothetical protein HJG60_011356 [Phyllostomus discolor]|uniref:Uncharacterized protein n=1 Tax=Phyllostomus discolor TaxID=89673 RepID=A0A834E1R2_9CHIR|nr:hypothetical protein HJG60_011356 [Phyllostomus discolor]